MYREKRKTFMRLFTLLLFIGFASIAFSILKLNKISDTPKWAHFRQVIGVAGHKFHFHPDGSISEKSMTLLWTSEFTGASIFNGLFNTNKQVYYINEPLRKIAGKFGQYHSLNLFLLDLLLCIVDTSHKELFLNFIHNKSFHHLLNSYKHCSHTACQEVDKIIQRFQKNCEKRSNVVVSESLTRVHGGLERLYRLSYSRQQPVQFLHVIRDPRAIMYSANKTGKLVNITEICQQNLIDLEYGIKNLPKKKFYFIRYEDIANEFDEKLEEILTFANIQKSTFRPEIIENLRKKVIKKLVDQDMWQVELVHGASDWKHVVNVVEQDCFELMDRTGYTLLNGDWDLLKKVNLNLYGNFKPFQSFL